MRTRRGTRTRRGSQGALVCKAEERVGGVTVTRGKTKLNYDRWGMGFVRSEECSRRLCVNSPSNGFIRASLVIVAEAPARAATSQLVGLHACGSPRPILSSYFPGSTLLKVLCLSTLRDNLARPPSLQAPAPLPPWILLHPLPLHPPPLRTNPTHQSRRHPTIPRSALH